MKIKLTFLLYCSILNMAFAQRDINFFLGKGSSAKVIFLSPSLKEISAIAIHKNKLLAIQDENGTLYEIDKNNGQIIDSLVFTPKGDFEGLCMANNTAWALETKGILWEIKNIDKAKHRKINKYHTPFHKKNDTEGITYDKSNNRLLIACKESPYLNIPKDSIKYMRAIYAFDLKTKQLNETPLFTYNFETINNFLAANPSIKLTESTVKKLAKGKSLPFKPTDIAISPKSKDIYVLCGTAFAILVFDPKNFQLKNILPFEESELNQAEGITFDKNSNIFIATEGIKIGNKENKAPTPGAIYYYKKQP